MLRRVTQAIGGITAVLLFAACSGGPDGAPQTVENPLPPNGGSSSPDTSPTPDNSDVAPTPPRTDPGETVDITPPPAPDPAKLKKRLVGVNLDTGTRWKVGGANLGIPYVLENGSIGYLFGDTFSTALPSDKPTYWRAPVMLRSASKPGDANGIVFDSAAKVNGNGAAPALFTSAADSSGKPGAEWTVVPTDGISFPETKRQLVAFTSIHTYGKGNGDWQTNYASLAFSDNGNDFTRVSNLTWANNSDNTDPFQQWTMQRDGDYVYIFSIRAGRQTGPMMLRRVQWEKMFTKSAYECWDASAGSWGATCTGVLDGRFGDVSVKKLKSGTWAMSYFNVANFSIVTRTASDPTGPWSDEKVQLTSAQEPNLYGGYMHPWSDTGPDNLHIMVSKFTNTEYHVSQWVGSL